MKFSAIAITALMGLASAAAIDKRDGSSSISESSSASYSASSSSDASETISSSASSSASVSIDVNSISQCGDAWTLIETAHQQVWTLTGSINSTLSGLTSSASQDVLVPAAATVKATLLELTTLVTATQKQCARIGASVELAGSHTTEELSCLISELLVEVESTASCAINILGYQTLYSALYKLNVALSGLVSSLGCIVVGLLALVQATLKTVLSGVSGVLGGVFEVLDWVL